MFVAYTQFPLEELSHVLGTLGKNLKHTTEILGFPKFSGAIFYMFCLPGPRGGRRWTRLVPQYDFPKFSSKSELWEGVSWPFFVLKNSDIRNVMRQGKHTTRQPLANLVREILVMGIGCRRGETSPRTDVTQRGGGTP